jgi:uncharacterized membrane protein YfcA
MTDPILIFGLLCLAALSAGAINSVAGGGTLLTFPALFGVLGQAVQANATSTFALLPGSIGGAAGYRREVYECRAVIRRLVLPSMLGGATGALMVTRFPPSVFAAVVPWLILGAAFLFLIQGPIKRLTMSGAHGPPNPLTVLAVICGQFVIGVYGGYFGAGIGILMLSLLPFMGTRTIHETNAAKTVLAALINIVTITIFVIEGVVVWKFALAMAVAAVVGGYVGAHFARRLPSLYVRLLVVVIGFTLAGYYLYREFAR